MTKIKICGLFREEDIEAVNQAKPDYCGFVMHFPKSHRNVTPEKVQELCKNLSKDIQRVGVLVNQPVEEAARLLNEDIIDIVQLHGNENEDYIRQLKMLTPTKNDSVWQAFQIKNKEDLQNAAHSLADMIVLDHGCGTGQTFDWKLLEDMQIEKPFFMAGGMRVESDLIGQAIRRIRPYGIDMSSGVETDRLKDRDKIIAAVAACRQSNI